jgi:cell division protein FtsA
MKKRIASAIDFGTSKIICVIGEQTASGGIDVLAYGKSDYAGIRHGAFVDEHGVGAALKRAVRAAQERAHLRIKRTVVGVPGAFIHAGLVRGDVEIRQKDRRVSMADVRAAVRAAERFDVPGELTLLHSVPQAFHIDGGEALRRPLGLRGNVLRAAVSCVLGEREFMARVRDILDELNIDVFGFVALPYAEPLYVVPDRERENATVVLDVGAWSTDICIVKNDALSWYALLEVGGDTITNDLAQGLGVSVEQAEQIKKRYVFGLETQGAEAGADIIGDAGESKASYELVQEIIEARVDEICALVLRRLEESGVPLNARTHVYLTGGGLSLMRGSREFVEARLRMPTRIFHSDNSLMHAPYYTSAVSLLEYIFKDQQQEDEAEPAGREGLIERIKRKLNSQGGK